MAVLCGRRKNQLELFVELANRAGDEDAAGLGHENHRAGDLLGPGHPPGRVQRQGLSEQLGVVPPLTRARRPSRPSTAAAPFRDGSSGVFRTLVLSVFRVPGSQRPGRPVQDPAYPMVLADAR